MKNKKFDYERVFIDFREKKSRDYKLSFRQDYRMRSLVKTVKLKKGKILDIGCAGGMFSESLRYFYPKAQIFGCDISKTAIEYAKKFGSGKVKYSVMKGKKFPYKDNVFDICICLDVLEHVPDVKFFLKEVKRVLKPNGLFFLIVPCEAQPFTHTWFFQKIGHGSKLTYRYYGHIHSEFSHKYVSILLEKQGFFIKERAYSEHAFYQLANLFTFFIPKVVLELLLGEDKTKKYSRYSNNIINYSKTKKDPVIVIRNFWFYFYDFLMMYVMYWETVILRKFPLTAWKLHALAVKNDLKNG